MRYKYRAGLMIIGLSIILCIAGVAYRPWITTSPKNSKSGTSSGSVRAWNIGAPSLSVAYAAGISGAPNGNDKYPYHGEQFTRFVSESMKLGGAGDAHDFYQWMDTAYKKCSAKFPGTQALSLAEALRFKKRQILSISGQAEKTQAEINTGAEVHKLIKAIIPRFSLDRGFEFCYVVTRGERQCFLQSVLISGLLQSMGIDAGVEMVYKNEKDQETNNGHAVCLVKLPNGHDIVVDASEPYPFAMHRGLFVRCADYRYVDPVYDEDSREILSYKSASGDQDISTASVHTLDTDFLTSQFWYYRGERAPGALLSPRKTASGLAAADYDLRRSVNACPENPLAVYMLGRVYLAEGHRAAAGHYLRAAYNLYSRFGWVPQGVREYNRRNRS